MDSQTLRYQKNEFINSVNEYIEHHEKILEKIEKINNDLSEGDDTLLYKYLEDVNKNLKEHIKELIIDANNYKEIVDGKVERKIRDLEEQERLLKEKNEEQEKG